MSSLFSKPTGVRYVDMCIYIDLHIYEENRDDNTIFKYMCLLGKMLAYKQHYFSNLSLYEDFAYYFACIVYNRMTDGSKMRIKSVLNYMKSILYFRKMAYENEVYSLIINPLFNKSWNEDLYKEITISNILSRDRYLLLVEVQDIIKGLPQCIKNNIPLVYKRGSLLYNNIYKSVLLSMLSRYTLPKRFDDVLRLRLSEKVLFNEVDFYSKHLQCDSVILWGIPDIMLSTVLLILLKVKLSFMSDINETISDYSLSDDEYNNLYTDIIFGDSKDEKYDTN